MIRQFFRLILYIIVRVKNLFFKYPGASLGLMIGAFIGFVLGASMVKYGFPKWVLPVQVVVWSVFVAPVVKKYLDDLTR